MTILKRARDLLRQRARPTDDIEFIRNVLDVPALNLDVLLRQRQEILAERRAFIVAQVIDHGDVQPDLAAFRERLVVIDKRIEEAAAIREALESRLAELVPQDEAVLREERERQLFREFKQHYSRAFRGDLVDWDAGIELDRAYAAAHELTTEVWPQKPDPLYQQHLGITLTHETRYRPYKDFWQKLRAYEERIGELL